MEKFNYLRQFSHLLANTEVPPRFAIWCGIASLLAALERRIWITQGIYNIYPNFYMVMVAASGQKKSTAINAAARVLRRLKPGPNVISQKITPEALIAAIQLTVNDPKAVMQKKNGGIVIADELATFLDRQALERGLGPILTALYDCTPFEYQTMSRGAEKVEDGYLSLLGGTTIELLKNSLPKDAIGGGFTSRTMFVYEDKIPPPVAWIEFDEALLQVESKLVEHLQRLLLLNGPVTLTREAKELFIADYNARHYDGPFKTQPLLKSYENRRHAHLLKIAMALMVSEEPSTTIEAQHIHGAKIILEEAEAYLPRVVELIVASEHGLNSSLIYQFILARHPNAVSRSELVRHFSHQFDAREISNHVDTLSQGKKVELTTDARGKLSYRIPKLHER